MPEPTPLKEILETNQPERLKESIEATCRICGATFPIWVMGIDVCRDCQREINLKEKNQEAEKELAEKSDDWRFDWLCQSGMPYVDPDKKTFEDYDSTLQQNAFKLITEYEWWEKATEDNDYIPANSIILASPGIYGVGKTHLACALLKKIVKDRSVGFVTKQGVAEFRTKTPVLFYRENDILSKIRNSYNDPDSETEEEIFKKLSNTDYLIIDDVGKVRPRDYSFMQGVYFRVIDDRYTSGGPMMLTTNLSLADLEKHIGGASADRLLEMCGKKYIITMKGQSYRRKLNGS